ncbi:hypothetical protein LR021_02975 [Candidatus Bipolaricaulota bacterium]|nr:hypothetical protein [Candidatus Bipolaricaulota bacterium]
MDNVNYRGSLRNGCFVVGEEIAFAEERYYDWLITHGLMGRNSLSIDKGRLTGE